MSALKEFANFVTLNMAGLAATYAQQLADAGFENISTDSRVAAARKTLKAVVEVFETQTSDPFFDLFIAENQDEKPRRWAEHIDFPDPLTEIECLGQTLTPAVTNLDAGKFLWQLLTQARRQVLQAAPAPLPSLQPAPADNLASELATKPQDRDITGHHQVDDQLRETELRYRMLVEQNPAAVHVSALDETSSTLYMSPQIETISGYTPEEWIADPELWPKLIHPDDRERILAANAQANATGQPLSIEYRLITKDGPVVWVREETRIISGEGGRPDTQQGLIFDITKRVQLEQQVRESLERRTQQVEISTEIAQEIAAAPALDDLFSRVVNLVQQRFNYYYAHVYALEDKKLVMKEGAGETGRQLKEAGHQIDLSAEKSLVARAARFGEPVLVSNVSSEPDWLPNALLPDTKSELAVPIKLKNEVLGVLDVQSKLVGGLTEEDEILLVGLCGQIAVAIDNRKIEAERQRAEEKLAEERNLLRTVIDNIPDSIYVKDKEGRHLIVNKAMDDATTGTLEEMLGKTDLELYPSEAASQWYADDMAVIQTGQAVINREELSFDEDKPVGWDLTTKVPLYDSQGKIMGLVGMSRDITEQKRIEEKLAEERNLLRTLIDNLPDLIYVKDTESRFVLVNRASLQAGQNTMDEIIGKTDFEVNPPDLAAQYYEDDQAVIHSGQAIIEREERNISPTGQARWVSTTKIPLHDSQGQIIGLVGASRDITERKLSEQALAAERNLLRAVIDALPDYVFVKDRESRYVIGNVAIARGIGVDTPDELTGKTDLEFFPPEIGQRFYADEQSLMETGQALIDHEELNINKDGVKRWFLTTRIPLRDMQGQVTGFVGLSRDITNLKEAETALRLSEERLRARLDASPDPIITYDPTGHVTYLNPAFEELFGWTQQEWLGKRLDFVPDEYQSETKAALEKLFSEGKVYGFQTKRLTNTGQLIDVEQNASVLTDKEGNITGSIIFIRDIRERKKAEEALRTSEDRYRTLLQESPDPIVIYDMEGNTTYINPAFTRVFGWTADELIGQKVDFVPEENRAEAYAAIQKVFKEGRISIESKRLTKDGRVLDAWGNASMLTDNQGNPAGMLAVLRDITERKQAEVERERLLAETQALYRISQTLSQVTDQQQVAEAVLTEYLQVLDLPQGGVMLFDEAQTTGTLIALMQNRTLIEPGLQLRVKGNLACERMIQTKAPVVITDALNDPILEPVRDIVHKLDYKSLLLVPIVIQGKVIGALGADSVDEIHHFTGREIELVQTVADRLGLALENQRLFADIQTALDETQALQQLSQNLAGTLQVDLILDTFFEACTTVIGFEYIQLSLVNKEERRIKGFAAVGVTESNLKKADRHLDEPDLLSDVVRSGQTEVLTGWDDRLDRAVFEAEGHANWVRVFMPVILRQETIGVIEAGFNKSVRANITDAHLTLLRTFVDQTALALDNARRYESSEKAARRERTIREITDKMRSAVNLEQLVKVTAEELGERFSAEYAMVELGVDASLENLGQSGNGHHS